MKKVAFLDTVHPVLKDGLEAMGWICDDFTQRPISEIENSIQQYQGIVIRSRFPMNQSFLEKATQLEFIARSGAGMENIDEAYCTRRNIQLFNAPEGNRNAVAEHALGMILSLFNKLHTADKEVREGVWDREGNRGIELEGKTIGLIGFGNNGAAFARVLRGFGVEVIAYDKYKSGFGDEYVQEVDLETLKQKAQIISLHIPQNAETLGWINDEFIKEVRHNFWLINLSRGKIVQTQSLLSAINSGKVLGACLDVLEFEKASFENMFDGEKNNELPLEFRELISSDKVLLSPHVGGWTYESYYKLSQVLLDKIKKSI